MRINNQTYINTCSLSVIEFIVKKIHNYSINVEQKNYISSLLNDEGLSINNLEAILSSYSIESETFYVTNIKKSDFTNDQIFIIPVNKEDYWHYLVVRYFDDYFYVFDSSNNSKEKLDDISKIYSNIIITVKKSSNIILSNLKTLRINKISLDINLKYILIVLLITIISSFFSILFYLRIQVFINSISSSFKIFEITSYFMLFICIEIFIHFCSFLNEQILKKIRSNNIKIINNIYSKKISKISVKTYEENKKIIKDFLDNSHIFIDYFFKSRVDILVLFSNCIIFIFISFTLGYLISITFVFFVLLEICINYFFSKYLKNISINQFYKSSFKSLLFSIFLFIILFLLSNINEDNQYLKYSNFFYSFFIYNIISFKISKYFSDNNIIFKKDELDHIYNKFNSLSDKSCIIDNYDTTVIYENNILNYRTVNKLSDFDINKLVFIKEKSIKYYELNYSNLRVFHANDNLYSNIEFNVSDYDKNVLFNNGYRINYDNPGFLERILISVISLINSRNNCIVFIDNSILSNEISDFLINKIKNKGRIYFYEKV